jgi:hypothetical protein
MPFVVLAPVDLYKVAYFIMFEPDFSILKVAVWSMVISMVQL